jgi:hypothetical protein
MKNARSSLAARLILAMALATLTGCSTIKYREVQSRFEQAVRADNDATAADQPFTETANHYAAIASELSPAYIAKLDAKLQPNAWTLRAVSEWRAGQFTNALQSANAGLNTIAELQKTEAKFEASRDAILLTMIPGLVEDSRLRQRLREAGPQDVAANYSVYAGKFHNALRALADAKGKMTAATPASVRYYWSYQCWRVLLNWQFVLGKLPPGDQGRANQDADEFIAANLGAKDSLNASTLPAAVKSAENAIPANHAYRRLIELEQRL